jgi:hypothetical protein
MERIFTGPTPETTSLISFLFVGRNGTPPSYLNLEDLPWSLVPCNTTQNPTYLDHFHIDCNPLLVSALMCDPQLEVLPAIINATTSSLEATTLSGDPTVKNIPTAAANTVFSTSLREAVSERSFSFEMGFLSAVSFRLFLPNLTFDMDGKVILKPLSLDKINQNMNNALASSAKAYLSGYQPNGDNPMFSSFAMVNTSAEVQVQKMAVVGSKPFFVALSVTVGLLVTFLGTLVAMTRPDQLEGFDLENIVRKLQIYHHSDSIIVYQVSTVRRGYRRMND